MIKTKVTPVSYTHLVDKKITDNSTDLTKKGLNFQADSGELIHKDLGQTLDVVGGITEKSKLSDNNIGVVSENGKLNVKLAKDLTGLNSVTTGQTTINNNGLTIGGNTFVTNNGFNANNTQIKNVKAGTEDSDAVNLKQLNEVKAASDTKVKGSKNIHVEEEINDLTKAKTYTVNLKDTVTLGSGSTSVHFAVSYTHLDVYKRQIVSGRAATEDQLKKVSEQITQQGSSATDYRLVRNSSADGSYKVNDNGEVSLTVEEDVYKRQP